MKKAFLVLVLFAVSGIFADAQAQIGINILNPDSSAVLHLESRDKGFLPTRLSTSLRDGINNPATGLIIYNYEDSTIQYFNGDCWLNVYQRSCDECEYLVTLSPGTGVIDRTTTDTVTATIDIVQTNGPGYPINLVVLSALPPGISATLDETTIDSLGSATLTVGASIFAPAGTYPIIVQTVCESMTQFSVFTVTVEPCINVDVTASTNNLNLRTYAGLPGPGTPVCVVANIYPGVEISSNDAANPAYTTGNVDPLTHVGIINDGAIIARGGDGGVGGGFTAFPPGDGGDAGGNAMDLSSKTTLVNNGYIYAGGSGGGSVGVGFSVPIPIIGTFTFAIGAGGGGGAADGEGGTVTVSLPVFEDGDDATGGVSGLPGAGGVLSASISIPISVVTINVSPSGSGGDGGAYAQVGAPGNIGISVTASVPFVGTISIYSTSATGPVSGPAGLAVDRNGNTLIGLPDGTYSTSFIKGEVAP